MRDVTAALADHDRNCREDHMTDLRDLLGDKYEAATYYVGDMLECGEYAAAILDAVLPDLLEALGLDDDVSDEDARAQLGCDCNGEEGSLHLLWHIVKQRDDLDHRLSGLLCDLTGGLLSKTGYEVPAMAQAIEEHLGKWYESDATDERDAARAKLDAVRELADEWGGKYCDDWDLSDLLAILAGRAES